MTSLTFDVQCARMAWSDILSGLGLIGFGYLSLNTKRLWTLWMSCFIGIWLQFAPLIFWSPTTWGYLNDTLVGVLAIALSIIIPGTPGKIEDISLDSGNLLNRGLIPEF